MIDIECDRRSSPRIALSRPCKVFEPRSQKYVAGRTCNLSEGGMLIRLDRRLNVEPGDHVYLGVAQKRRQQLIRSADMIEATVVRALGIGGGEFTLALRFNAPAQELHLPFRRAA
jgi:hypothetical protein